MNCTTPRSKIAKITDKNEKEKSPLSKTLNVKSNTEQKLKLDKNVDLNSKKTKTAIQSKSKSPITSNRSAINSTNDNNKTILNKDQNRKANSYNNNNYDQNAMYAIKSRDSTKSVSTAETLVPDINLLKQNL